MENKYDDSIKDAPDVREYCDELLIIAEEKWGNTVSSMGEQPPREPGTMVKINYACAWNKPSDMDREGKIIATNGKFCIIATAPPVIDPPNNIYRHEDVSPRQRNHHGK